MLSSNPHDSSAGAMPAVGFTLIELMITLLMVSVLLIFAAPTVSSVIASSRVETTSDSISRTVHLARAEAIKRGHRVVACMSDGAKCNPKAKNALIVFSDTNQTGNPSSPKDLIYTLNISQTTTTVSYNRPFLAFSAVGSASGTNGSFAICDISGKGTFVVVSTLGRTRKGRDYDGDGVVEKYPGSPINC